MIGLAILAAVGAAMWMGMIYVLVMEPVRFYLRVRRLKRAPRSVDVMMRAPRSAKVGRLRRTPAIRGVTVLPPP